MFEILSDEKLKEVKGGVALAEGLSTEELKKELDKRMAESSKVKKRFEIVGEWSGYNSSQRRIVHREYTTNKVFADNVKNLGSIYYSDGTSLKLTVRQLEYKERKKANINGSTDLIRKCVAKGVNSVDELK